MKKSVFILLILASFSLTAQQISKNALGIRIGSNSGIGLEVSYQKAAGYSNRYEFNVGYNDNNNASLFRAVGLYEWVWNLDEGFNWYAGVGAGVGLWDADNTIVEDDGLFINGAGNIGLEYDFPSPLLISLDLRPELRLIGDYGEDTLQTNLGLSFRYQF
jgi:opacity protein-like surface antigen